MTLPDITQLSLDELNELLVQAAIARRNAEASQQTDRDARRVTINNEIAELEALLGPEGSPPGLDSIRGVLGFSDQDMANNSGLAFRLAFLGMEQLTKTMLDIAHVLGK